MNEDLLEERIEILLLTYQMENENMYGPREKWLESGKNNTIRIKWNRKYTGQGELQSQGENYWNFDEMRRSQWEVGRGSMTKFQKNNLMKI